jgi:hypothetical protein
VVRVAPVESTECEHDKEGEYDKDLSLLGHTDGFAIENLKNRCTARLDLIIRPERLLACGFLTGFSPCQRLVRSSEGQINYSSWRMTTRRRTNQMKLFWFWTEDRILSRKLSIVLYIRPDLGVRHCCHCPP